MLFLFCLSFLLSGVSAVTLTATLGSSTLSTVQCSTKSGTKSVKAPIPTTSSTKTGPTEILLILGVSTPTQTITPPAVTTTSTVPAYTTVTSTDSTMTGIFSSTTTVFTTTTTTNTATVATTATVTTTSTSTTTVIVPTPDGFINIYNSSGDRTQKPSQKRARLAARALSRLRGRTQTTTPKQYPQSVTCVKAVHIRYVVKLTVVKPTTTITARPATTTVRSTSTITSTSTVVPPRVTSTQTFSTTSTITATTATTVTTTATTATVTETVITTTSSYAACATQNLLGPQIAPDGRYIYVVFPTIADDDVGTIETTGIPSAYDCCVACITNTDVACQFSAFESGMCTQVFDTTDPNTCRTDGYLAGKFYSQPTLQDDDPIILSNGRCGILEDGDQ